VYDTKKSLELHPICLLAVWPVSVSYRHLPVGIFGSVFLDLAGAPFCEILRELLFVNLAGTYFSLKRGLGPSKRGQKLTFEGKKGFPPNIRYQNAPTKFSFGIGW
jgi:hypothetical protein